MIQLSGSDYFVVYVVAGAVFAAAAVVSYRRLGAAGLRMTATLGAGLLFALGYFDWRRLVSKETPLTAYAVIAIMSPLLSAYAVYRSRHRPVALQWGFGTASFCAAAIASTFLTYALSDFFPI